MDTISKLSTRGRPSIRNADAMVRERSHAEFPDRTARLVVDFARASETVLPPATPERARLSR